MQQSGGVFCASACHTRKDANAKQYQAGNSDVLLRHVHGDKRPRDSANKDGCAKQVEKERHNVTPRAGMADSEV